MDCFGNSKEKARVTMGRKSSWICENIKDTFEKFNSFEEYKK